MRIRKYTLNFIRLGRPVNNQYPIYLRYFYTLNGKKESYNINCHTLLSIEQLELLKEEELSPSIQLPLLKKKKEINDIIKSLYVKYNQYPEKHTLKKYLTVKSKGFTVATLIDRFTNTFRNQIKDISLKKYNEYLTHFQNYIKLNSSKFNTVEDLVSTRTVTGMERYLDGLGVLKEKPISNSSFKNIISMTVRFLNFVAEEYDISPVPHKVKLPLLSEKIHITQTEFRKMINYDVEMSELRKDHKANMKQAQDIVYINSFIGLRINELLNIRKPNITFNEDHVIIKFHEQKKNDIRRIILVDKKAIELLKKYFNRDESTKLFSLHVNVFNNNLKALAKLTGMTELIEYNKNHRTETITLTKAKWELISSHALRRYAVNQNVVNYGIDIARQFSGHKDYITIKKNYMRNINENELLERLKKDNVNV